MSNDVIRDAATVIVLRDGDTDPRVLMGQRAAAAAFMPGKFVFPGGAVEPGDGSIAMRSVPEAERAKLLEESKLPPEAITAAAIRELWEETGQILGEPGELSLPPENWQRFAATNHRPDASALRFFFRAVTPAGRPRRFDARFFLVPAGVLASDPDDFSAAEEELSHLQWVPLGDARTFDLPFITQVVLAELSAYLRRGGGPLLTVPFFRNDDEAHLVTRLQGRSPLASENED